MDPTAALRIDSKQDEVPLARRTKPATKNAAQNSPSNARPATLPADGVKGRSNEQRKDRKTDGKVKEENSGVKKEETVSKQTGVQSDEKPSTSGRNAKGSGGTQNGQTKQPVKRVKKTYDMPGQTRETPTENEPLRNFYGSLKEQRPESDMATKWCVQHGLLPEEDALAWLEKNNKLKGATGRGRGGRGRGTGGRGSGRSSVSSASGSGRGRGRGARNAAKKRMSSTALPPREISRAKKAAKMDSDDDFVSEKPKVVRKRKAPASANGTTRNVAPKKEAKPGKEICQASEHSSSDDDLPLAKRRAELAR